MKYDKLFELAKSKGISDFEIYVSKDKKLSLNIYKGKVESNHIADNEVMSARGIYNGKMGTVYSEKMTKESFEFIVDSIISNALLIEEKKSVSIFAGSKKYKNAKLYNDSFDKVSTQEKIDRIIEAEKEGYKVDSRISDLAACSYEEEQSEVTIINSKGLKLKTKTVDAMFYCEAVAKEDNEVKTGFVYQIMGNYNEFEPKRIIINSAKEAISQLKGEPVKSKKYKIVMDGQVLASFIGSLKGSIYGESVNKEKSKLAGKLNTKIASNKVTLIENPHCKDLPFFYRAFDDEGVATMPKKIIDKGVLKTFLYNIESALAANVESTGNGYKAGALGTVNTGTTLLELKPGKPSKEELFAKVKDGLYITDIAGIHAGMEPLSGDFSLQANGFVIENGQKVRPVNLITIAGNLFKMFEDIKEVGNDSFVTYSGIKCPSVIIKSLVVSGK